MEYNVEYCIEYSMGYNMECCMVLQVRHCTMYTVVQYYKALCYAVLCRPNGRECGVPPELPKRCLPLSWLVQHRARDPPIQQQASQRHQGLDTPPA